MKNSDDLTSDQLAARKLYAEGFIEGLPLKRNIRTQAKDLIKNQCPRYDDTRPSEFSAPYKDIKTALENSQFDVNAIPSKFLGALVATHAMLSSLEAINTPQAFATFEPTAVVVEQVVPCSRLRTGPPSSMS